MYKIYRPSLRHKVARAAYYNRKSDGEDNPARYSPPRNTIFDRLGFTPLRLRIKEIHAEV